MRFRRWVVFTFAVHVLIIVLDKGSGLVLYKILEGQPEMKGAADMLTVLPFIMMAVANLGLATSTVFFLRKQQFGLEPVAGTTSLVALVWGSAAAGIAILLSQTLLPLLGPNWGFSLSYVVPICLCVPFLLTASYFNSIQLALDKVRDYNLVQLTGSVVFLPLFLVFYYVGDTDAVHGIAWARLAGAMLLTAVTLWLLRGVVRWRPRMHWGFFRAGIGYGWKANLTSVLTYLNHRFDLYLVGFLFVASGALAPAELRDRQLEQVAFYSLAVTFAELVWHFPEAIRDLFFSKVAGSTHDQARTFTPVLCRLCVLVSVLGSVAIYFLVNPFMTLISSEKWPEIWQQPVLASLIVLFPGTVAYTIAKILQNDLAARGHLNQVIVACTLVLVTMVVLDIVLIPEHGAVGAAWASSIAYVVSSVYTLIAYSGRGGASIPQCLFARRVDLDYAHDLFAAIGEKVRGWRS